MKTLLFAALTGALVSPIAADFQSTFTPGEVRTTIFSIDETSSLVEVEVIMNGEENPMDGGMQQEQTFSTGGTFTDKILRAEGSELNTFTRTYSDLMADMTMDMVDPMGEANRSESSSESDLEDVTVLFTLDEGDFVASYPEDESGDEELLEGLLGQLPFADFLPDGEAEIDAEWEVEPTLIWDVLNLGGELSLVDADSDEEDAEMMKAFNDDDLVEIEGEVDATLTSIEDGLATIALVIEMTRHRDLTDAVNAMTEAQGDAEGMPQMDLMEDEKQYEGEGTLVWNLRGGYLVSLELELTYEEVQTMNMVLPFGPDGITMEQTMTSEGEASMTIEVEVTRD